ncbi:MAG TPA: ferrous iron transport protein B, partial [Rhodobacteraceae bacterium]|nr:ferrous iron transport protein B [Paracoccaceae bacterium]
MKDCCSQGDCGRDSGPAGDFTIGIAGNPNCGKTTLFNSLTGSRQRVGNWPGVTVERKSGLYRDGSGTLKIIDLPGVYTLGVLPGLEEESLDERLARNHIMDDDLDVLVNIVDASNLERNLYLTAQLVETGRPMVVALNMMDAARQSGLNIDIDALARALGCPVIPMVASRGKGLVALLRAVRQVAASGQAPRVRVTYAPLLERILEQMQPQLEPAARTHGVLPRWLAVRLFEGDDLALKMTGEAGARLRRQYVPAAEAELGEDADILIADGRFSFAHAVTRAAVTRTRQAERRLSDSLDRLVLSRFAGPFIFLGIIYLMFMFTINLGGVFVDFFDQTAAAIFVDGTKAVLGAVGAPLWLKVLLGDGLGGGIQVVATFVPIIGFLYLFLSLIEDSGYMARAAFLMDRLMRVVGLPGKAFVPLIVGFGCNVPAIMSARTLDRERDRIMTVMMSPFMSCGARLTVYALFAAAFFPRNGTNIVFALYLIGILAAIATGFLLKHTLLKGETTPFLMELPPYRLPRLRDVALAAWVKLKSFVFGAGKIIIIVITV